MELHAFHRVLPVAHAHDFAVLGACGDLGYWMRSGIDPIQAARMLKDRLLTVQMHDLHATGSDGHDVPWGTGVGKSE